MPKDSLRRRADALARLLADERGAEILAELQKLGLETGSSAARPRGAVGTSLARADAAQEQAVVGAWLAVSGPGGTELRRRELPADELRGWADVERVPAPDGAARVVLLGESSARGFLLDPVLTPALALSRRLAEAGEYQVVDLAHVGADLRDLAETLLQVPAVVPQAVVVYAGNNWVRPRHTPAHLDLLAGALRAGDYAGMRRAYLERIVAPGVRRTLDCLSWAAARCGAEVVVVLPEFNLREWTHDPELELPPLPAKELLAWTERRAEAEAALAAGQDAPVLDITAEMARTDQGMSPVTGRLRAEAAIRLGQPDEARAALETARDAVCGLLSTHTPRVTAEVRAALAREADRCGFRTVDLAELLRSDGGSGLPDPGCFLDYCHLSASGIERTAAAVADALLGRPVGSTPSTDVLPAAERAVGDLLAAMHNSYYGQPDERVSALVARGVAVPEGQAFAEALRRLLEGTGPVWACEAVAELTAYPHAARYLAPMMSRSAEMLGMWSLQRALRDVAPPPPAASALVASPAPARTDVLRTAEQGLLDGAFLSADHRPERAFLQCFGPVVHLGFRATTVGGTVRLTYRVPSAIQPDDRVRVVLNGVMLGDLPPVSSWTTAELSAGSGVLCDGVNTVSVHWPCGGADWADRRHADARRLARGDYPLVRGVQGELFDLTLDVGV